MRGLAYAHIPANASEPAPPYWNITALNSIKLNVYGDFS